MDIDYMWRMRHYQYNDMDYLYSYHVKVITPVIKCGMKWPKIKRLHRGSFKMDKLFHPKLYYCECACDYLSMLVIKFIHGSKRGLKSLSDTAKHSVGDHPN